MAIATPPKPNQQVQPPAVNPLRLNQFTQEIRDNQNLSLAIIAGGVASIVGAVIWAMVTYFTGYQIGWMAIGVGVLVGLAVKKFGQGIDKLFGVAGAALAMFGCVTGNILSACLGIAEYEGMPFADVLAALNPNVIVGILVETFHPMDLLFYGLAIYQGYKISIRKITEEEMKRLA
jgi:hypothetical protein